MGGARRAHSVMLLTQYKKGQGFPVTCLAVTKGEQALVLAEINNVLSRL
jgi:hypothetical protein